MSIVQHRYNKIANYCEELRRMVKTQKPDNSRIMKHGGELRISLPLIPDDENSKLILEPEKPGNKGKFVVALLPEWRFYLKFISIQ